MSLRILFCGAFDRHRRFARYYNTDHKLRNGLIRLGHQVLAVDTRATVRDLAPLGIKRWGVARMRADILAVAEMLRPHLVVFGHSDLVDGHTYERLRAGLTGVRFTSFFVDPFTTRPHTLERLRQRARHMDTIFATTAEARVIEPYAPRRELFWFMPNVVDPGIETGRTDELTLHELPYDGIFLGTDIGTRRAQLDEVRARLPPAYRFHTGGRRQGDERLNGTAFLEAVRLGAVCPQLPLDDAEAAKTPHLYTSGRIAHTLGQGVLALTPARAELERLYEDGVVAFGSRAALAVRVAELRDDDARRRRLAGSGRRLIHARMRGDRVARYVVETSMEWRLTESYEWPTDPIV